MSEDVFEANDCAGCAGGTSRRDFLRRTLVVAGALTVARAGTAAALPTHVMNALARTGAAVTYPVPAADGVHIDKDNDIMLTRWQGSVYAFSLACPHQKTALKWQAANAQFACPKHKSKFKPDGTFISGKATRPLDRFALRRDGANIIVDNAKMIKQNEDAAAHAAAVVKI